jgi:hypothetical protein
MKHNVKKRGRIPIIGDMIFSLMTLPGAMGYIQKVFTDPNDPDLELFFIATYIMMGIARLFRAFRYRDKSRIQFVKFLIYGVLMLIGSLSVLVFDLPTSARIFILIYNGSLIADRAISCYLDRKPRNLILNVIAIVLLGWVTIEMCGNLDLVFALMIFVVLHSLVSIMSVAFARINLKMLASVAQETYAAEIIGGMVLLIFAFSYILQFLEPNMGTLKDSLWYCFAIVTTIGFGDITATTLVGRILSVILGLYGIVVVALITSVIVNYYGEMKRENAQGDNASQENEGK